MNVVALVIDDVILPGEVKEGEDRNLSVVIIDRILLQLLVDLLSISNFERRQTFARSKTLFLPFG